MSASARFSNQPTYLPTPAEIAAACELIRATWSAAELERRVRGRVDSGDGAPAPQRRAHWRPPVIHVEPDVAAMLQAS